MMRVPWAPLNFGVFLIVFGSLILTSLLGIIPLAPLNALPLVFVLFGAWLALLGTIIPPSKNPYSTPRILIVGWGAVLTGVSILWFIAFNIGELLPVTFATLIIIAGIAAVGYSFLRAQNKQAAARPA